jgi:hypothetical protein
MNYFTTELKNVLTKEEFIFDYRAGPRRQVSDSEESLSAQIIKRLEFLLGEQDLRAKKSIRSVMHLIVC